MALQVGDKVRTSDGAEGHVVSLIDDGQSAMVIVNSDGPDLHINTLPVTTLALIPEFPSALDPPA